MGCRWQGKVRSLEMGLFHYYASVSAFCLARGSCTVEGDTLEQKLKHSLLCYKMCELRLETVPTSVHQTPEAQEAVQATPFSTPGNPDVCMYHRTFGTFMVCTIAWHILKGAVVHPLFSPPVCHILYNSVFKFPNVALIAMKRFFYYLEVVTVKSAHKNGVSITEPHKDASSVRRCFSDLFLFTPIVLE